jgi:hypothetical protein
MHTARNTVVHAANHAPMHAAARMALTRGRSYARGPYGDTKAQPILVESMIAISCSAPKREIR